METAIEHTIVAVRESALELGFAPLVDALVERVVEYGVEALVECTLAAQQGVAIDANVRSVFYARSIERISAAVAAPYGDVAISR